MGKVSDIQKEVTNKVVSALENGVKPWEQPWQNEHVELSLPFNASTGLPYRGINILMLWMSSLERNFTSAQWITFNQARAEGWKIKKGSIGEKVCFYQSKQVEEVNTEGDVVEKTIPYLKAFTVFNMDDVDVGDGEPVLKTDLAKNFQSRALNYSRQSGVEIVHGGGIACYYPSIDQVRMPPSDRFKTPDGWAVTLAHELIHSTGAKSRTDRISWVSKKYSVNGDQYAFEELVAELGAAFIGAEYGFSGSHHMHASYLDHWLKVLKADQTAIFKAASKASKAVEYFNCLANKEHTATDVALV